MVWWRDGMVSSVVAKWFPYTFFLHFRYRSCAFRDVIGQTMPCDLTWLHLKPVNPLNVGQTVNNQTRGMFSVCGRQDRESCVCVCVCTRTCVCAAMWVECQYVWLAVVCLCLSLCTKWLMQCAVCLAHPSLSKHTHTHARRSDGQRGVPRDWHSQRMAGESDALTS